MKYYKDENNQIYAYEDNIPEFGSYIEVEKIIGGKPIYDEDGDQVIDKDGNAVISKQETIVEKIYNTVTVKEGLISITEDEANTILNPPLSDAEIQAEIELRNKSIQSSLMKDANAAIEILQDAIDLDIAEDTDEERLKAWKIYRVTLNRVDVTQENVEFPTKPE